MKFTPLIDKLFYCISIPSILLVLLFVVIPPLFDPSPLFITAPVFLLVLYFIISPLFGYVELREETLLIKYGFFLKKEIPYSKIRSVEKKRGFISESMMSLKNAMEHVNIRYNSFDVTTVSVRGNDTLIEEINKQIRK